MKQFIQRLLFGKPKQESVESPLKDKRLYPEPQRSINHNFNEAMVNVSKNLR